MKTKDAYLFLLIISCMHLCCYALSWHGSATYLFAPGLWSSEHQIAKYCSSYKASTGELVTASHGFEVINGTTAISCNFPEIQLRRLYKTDDVYWYMIPGIVCTALLAKLGKHILETSNNRYQITISGKSKNKFSINPYLLNLLQLSFGQDIDIKVIAQSYKQLINDNTLPEDIILYGVSRGAVAAFNFIATLYEGMQQKNIKAIVLESCFDALPNMTSLSYLLSLLLPHYKHQGIAPLQPSILNNFVAVCNKYNIAVLLISSLADQRVPYKNSQNLYEQLVKAGLKNVHFLTLQHSIHSGYTHDDANDTKNYLYALHTFYKRYGLAYIPDYLTMQSY